MRAETHISKDLFDLIKICQRINDDINSRKDDEIFSAYTNPSDASVHLSNIEKWAVSIKANIVRKKIQWESDICLSICKNHGIDEASAYLFLDKNDAKLQELWDAGIGSLFASTIMSKFYNNSRNHICSMPY